MRATSFFCSLVFSFLFFIFFVTEVATKNTKMEELLDMIEDAALGDEQQESSSSEEWHDGHTDDFSGDEDDAGECEGTLEFEEEEEDEPLLEGQAVTENGARVHSNTGAGDALVTLSFQSVRQPTIPRKSKNNALRRRRMPQQKKSKSDNGQQPQQKPKKARRVVENTKNPNLNKVQEAWDNAIGSVSADPKRLVELAVLLFHTRDISGGKGEYSLFCRMLISLYATHPDVAVELMTLIPKYGSWKDLNHLVQYVAYPESVEACGKKITVHPLVQQAASMFAEALTNDNRLLLSATSDDDGGEKKLSLSLAGKWAPRESSSLRRFAKMIAERMFDKTGIEKLPGRLWRDYRKVLTRLNEHLGTVEVKMAGRRFASINPAHVPGRAMKIYEKAFFNDGDVKKTDEDRVACANNFTKFVLETNGEKLKVNTIQLHEILAPYLHGEPRSSVFQRLDRMKWERKREILLEQHPDILEHGRRTLCICDVSGSMSGTPMDVCIALGIFISGLGNSHFFRQIVTFSQTPNFHRIEGESLQEMVQSLAHASWGMNTNLEAVFNMLLTKALTEKIAPNDMPNRLMIMSDMQFDAAMQGSDKKMVYMDVIRQKYEKAGYEVPEILFWNLRPTMTMPATTNEAGVVLLSGFSEALLMYALAKTDVEVAVADVSDDASATTETTATTTTRKRNAEDVFKSIVENERYAEVCDLVKAILAGV